MTGQSWIDKQGDVWRLGDDGLLHTPETAPFPREYVERKWGPLRECSSLAELVARMKNSSLTDPSWRTDYR